MTPLPPIPPPGRGHHGADAANATALSKALDLATKTNVERLARRVHDYYCQRSPIGRATFGCQEGLIEATALILNIPANTVLQAMRGAGHPYPQDRETFGARVAELPIDTATDKQPERPRRSPVAASRVER